MASGWLNKLLWLDGLTLCRVMYLVLPLS